MANGLDPVRDLGFKVFPEIAGTYSGRVFVAGSGRCLWSDISSIPGVHRQFRWVPVKQAGLYLPYKFDHWMGGHAERWQWYKPLAKGAAMIRDPNGSTRWISQCTAKIHAPATAPCVDYVWGGPLGGTSGLFAVRVLLGMGFDEVILCGMPMDGSGRFYDPPWENGCDLGTMDEWEKYAPVLRGLVKSMSGNTRKLLGGL